LRLCRLHALGRIYRPDLAEGWAWCHLAAARGNQRAIAWRDGLARKMTPAQIARAKVLAAKLKRIKTDTPAPSCLVSNCGL